MCVLVRVHVRFPLRLHLSPCVCLCMSVDSLTLACCSCFHGTSCVPGSRELTCMTSVSPLNDPLRSGLLSQCSDEGSEAQRGRVTSRGGDPGLPMSTQTGTPLEMCPPVFHPSDPPGAGACGQARMWTGVGVTYMCAPCTCAGPQVGAPRGARGRWLGLPCSLRANLRARQSRATPMPSRPPPGPEPAFVLSWGPRRGIPWNSRHLPLEAG